MFVDGTHVKVHQHSNGGKESPRHISKSVAGLAMKIYLAVNTYGNPITCMASDSDNQHIKVGPDLINKVDISATDALCADKCYDSESLRTYIKQEGCCDNIPRKNI